MVNTDKTLMQINWIRNQNFNITIKMSEINDSNNINQSILILNPSQLGTLLFEIERNYDINMPYIEKYVKSFNYNNYKYLIISQQSS
jgi:hypothetical protein